jgi:hypothetical protein
MELYTTLHVVGIMSTHLDLGSILKELRTSKVDSPRSDPGERCLVKGGKAWRRRLKRQKQEQEKQLDQLFGRQRAQARYHRKNRERLNRARAQRARSPEYVYKRAMRFAKEKDQQWDFTFDTWWEKWSTAPKVKDEGSGFMVPAWNKRGPNWLQHTQLTRIDQSKGWSVENTEITLNGIPLS